jgi:hypothetical protein
MLAVSAIPPSAVHGLSKILGSIPAAGEPGETIGGVGRAEPVEALQFVRAHERCGRSSVSGDDHGFTTFGLAHAFRQSRFRFRQGNVTRHG